MKNIYLNGLNSATPSESYYSVAKIFFYKR
jgi:hypothetical protein